MEDSLGVLFSLSLYISYFANNMTVFISYSQLGCAFRDYNDMYFEGSLPMPEFEIIHSFKNFGLFESQIYNGTIYNPVIKISDQWDYTKHQFRNILVHEMVHYYLAYNGIDMNGSHGKHFSKMAKELNTNFGLNITKRINLTEYKRKNGTSWLKYTLSKIF